MDRKIIKPPGAAGKRTMNFVQRQTDINLRRIVLSVLGVLILSVLFIRFAILEPLERKEQAQKEWNEKRSQLDTLNHKLDGYGDVEKNYGRFSNGWLGEADVQMVSCLDALILVEEEIASRAVIENLAVNNNVLTLNIHGITLEQASVIVERLEKQEIVESAAVYHVIADDVQDAKIFMRVTLVKGDS